MNNNRIVVLSLAAVAAAVGIWAFATRNGGDGDELDQVSLVLNWVPNGTHAAYYAAADQGFYRDEGLEVKILEGSGSGTAVKVVGAGREEFAVASAESVAIGRSKGIPVVSLAALYQRNPVCLLSLTESGITKPEDLVGKKMGVKFGSSTFPLYEAITKTRGIDRESIEEIAVGPGIEPLLAGKVDAMNGHIDNEPVQVRHQGKSVETILYHDLGIRTYGMCLLSSEEVLKEKGDVARRFVRATLKGWGVRHREP